MKDFKSHIFKSDPSINELLENTLVSILILTDEGQIIYANPEALELFGVNKNIIGKKFEELFFLDSVSDIQRKIKVIIEGESLQKEQLLRIRSKGNEPIWGIIKLSSLKHLSSNKVVLCQIKNISELKDYEKAMAKQNHLLLELINSIPDNIFIKNTRSEFLLANKWVSNLMGGRDVEDLLGKTDFDFHPKKLAAKYYDDEQEVINTGKARMNIIEQVIDSNNNRRWYSTSKLPLKDNEGIIIGIMGIGRDITSWVKEQKLLRKAKLKAERADQLKSAFLANLSHEIRTPLNGILGFSQFIRKSLPEDDKNNKYIDFILANGKQLLHQINDIIDISKIDSGQFPVYKRNFSIPQIMSELKHIYNEKMKQLGLNEIELRMEEGLENEECEIYNDDLRIKQVLGNFLDNAIKFTNKGEIQFGYSIEEKDIRFYVRDNGIGISAKNIKAIFDRFHQVDFSLSRKYEGAGLGLAIADGIVKLLDGKIGAKSLLNKGSEFYFTIPYEKAHTEANETDGATEDHLKSKRVVVVDGNKQSYDLLEIILFQNNAEVFHAENQNSFYKLISSRQSKFDLIIINMFTKWVKGCTSIQKIKSVNSRIPVLLIVNDKKDINIRECMAAGADDFILAPLQQDKIIEKLKKLID